MIKADEVLLLIAKLMLKKFGEDQILRLLSDEMIIDINKTKDKRIVYTREFANPEHKTPFTDYDGHELDPDSILEALDDAANNMNYSNWHTDKFGRAAEAVIRYCEDHKIEINFRRRTA